MPLAHSAQLWLSRVLMRLTDARDKLPEHPLDENAESGNKTQKPLSVSQSHYVSLGAVRMVPGPDGLPVPAGEPRPPAEWLTDDNFVCAAAPESGRPACRHYAALLVPHEGQVKGFGNNKPKSLRRFCTKLAAQSELMELTETEVFACTLRDPPDPASAAKIEAFEAEQKRLAEILGKEHEEIDL